MFLIISFSLFLINLIEFSAFNYEIKSISATEFEKNNQKKVDIHNEIEIRNETTLSNNITLNNFFGAWTGTIEFFHFQFGLDELGNRIIKDVSKYSENEYNFLEQSGDLFFSDVEEPGYCHITEGPISNNDVARGNYESNSLKQFSKKNLQLAVSGNNLSGSMEICVYSGNMDDNTTNSYGVFNVDVNLKIINENTLEGEYIWENEPFSIYLTRDEIWQKILKELGNTPTDESSYREVVNLMNNATVLYNEEKYYDALAKYDEILQNFPRYTRALEGKSLSLIYLGQYVEAEKILNTVIQLDPENEELKKHKENLFTWQESAKRIGDPTLTPKEINSLIEELNKSVFLSKEGKYNESIVKLMKFLENFQTILMH